ncbi:hypothetical protein ACFQX6_33440 [Streptosporangium lutulentum]
MVLLTLAADPVLAVVVEVQRGRDADKRWSWPVYLTTLRARTRCPAVLLVICADTRTATWCRTPIHLGHPGWTLAPLVVGPEAVPLVTDAKQAADAPELAVLSAMAHGGAPEGIDVLQALFGALAVIDDDQARLYSDFVLMALPAAARQSLEELMKTGTYEYQSDFARKYVAEGRTEGLAEERPRGGQGSPGGPLGPGNRDIRRRQGAHLELHRYRANRDMDSPRGYGEFDRRAVRLSSGKHLVPGADRHVSRPLGSGRREHLRHAPERGLSRQAASS